MIPAKADIEQQVVYLETVLEPRLADAQAGTRAVCFVDAAHFVLAPFLGYLWSFVRLFIQAPAHTSYKSDLDSLLTLNFQRFKNRSL